MTAPLERVLDSTVLRTAFGCFPSGVTAVCAEVDGLPVGMAASSFTSVSIDPPLVSVCVAIGSNTWLQLRGSARVGVSVLSAGQEVACRQLASKSGDRFAGLSYRVTEEGAILLDDSALVLDCSLDAELPAGDHHIALLRIHGLAADHETAPLVFHRSGFPQLVPIA